MQQFHKPLKLPGTAFDYNDNFMINDADTASQVQAVKPPSRPYRGLPLEPPRSGYREELPRPINIPKCIAMVLISLFTLYTFAIICVELFKIFAQIVAR